MNNLTRGILTATAVSLWAIINWFVNVAAPIISSELAGKQFENSDTSYFVSRGAQFFTGSGLPLLVLLVILVVIWWKLLRNVFMAAIVLAFLAAPHASAYYDKYDYAEPYFVLPNESAFFIPDVGANQDSQTQFGSEEYLRKNKIAAKRFLIPHVKLENSGVFSNYVVPAGRLVIVDRTPYNREWVASAERGTSSRDESFRCQSKEGLDITTGISIGTSLLEENAPKYLYRFGVKSPEGDRTKPEVIFASVLYSRSLAEAMDGVVRNNIQTLVCNEFTKRSFDEGNAQAVQIMEVVRTNVTTYLTSVGITIDFIGWADTFRFDPNVQDAINRRYVATQDLLIAQTLAPHTSTIQALAAAEALRTFASKSDGKLPTNVSLWWLPSSISDIFSGWFKAETVATPTKVPNPAPAK